MRAVAVRQRIFAAGGVERADVLPLNLVVLGVAIVFAAVRQGAYDGHDFAVVEALLAIAAAVSVANHTLDRTALRHPAVIAAALVGASTVISAWASGEWHASLPTVGMLACGAVIAAIVATTPTASRELFLSALLSLAVLTALTGWWGVAAHHSPWSLVDGGLWRAASTITYANATAAFLAPAALLTLGRLARREPTVHTRLQSMAGAVLLAGCGATLSRGGLVGLAVGWLVMAAWMGWRPTLRATFAPAVGAVVVIAGLVPAFPFGHGADPALAAVALVIGLAVAGGLAGRSPDRGAIAVGLAIGGLILATGAIPADRFSLSSPDRGHEWSATWSLAVRHPVTGVGPGPFAVSWSTPQAGTMTDDYTHNEYLQLLAQQGSVGGALGATAIAVFGVAVVRRRRAERVRLPTSLSRHLFAPADAVIPDRAPMSLTWTPGPAPAVAGLVALAVHSGFDFLWHVPLIPLFGAVLAGAALTARES